VKLRRSSVLLLAAGTLVLTACGNLAPPAKELADEMVDTLRVDGQPLPDSVKACMKDEIAGFELTESEATGFNDFDDVAAKAAEGQEQAKQILQRFQDALAACNSPG
jgi:predicted NBD/HSP70 family sugar kinase